MSDRGRLEEVGAAAMLHANRGVFVARRALARERPPVSSRDRRVSRSRRCGRWTETHGRRRRNVLLITVDQQRFDALGCHGQEVARTPHLDALAADGIDFRRAHVQNVVCMPSRSTILTGQHPRTHGVVANGVALPHDALSVADVLRAAGYRTALVGKPHFGPHLDLLLRHAENRVAWGGASLPVYGFEHMEIAGHGPIVQNHYTDWLYRHDRSDVHGFAPVLTGAGGGDTGAPEVCHNPIASERYHTDWVAERTTRWIAEQGADPWFCWMSFPDPHHPYDPPVEEVRRRVDWRDVPLPENHIRDRATARAVLSGRPAHWLGYFDGTFTNPEGGPSIRPSDVTADQLREITAMVAVENELIDDAVGRVLADLERLGIAEDTDVIYTSDHGDLGGDFGLLFKGPYHVDSLLRIPLIWRPAASQRVAPAVVDEPVGLIDLAPTMCAVAGVEAPAAMEGSPLPTEPGSGRERVLTTWDSQFRQVGMHLRTIYRDGWLCTRYEPSTTDVGGRFALYWAVWGRRCTVPRYDGTEGELYDGSEDPHQRVNRWHDPAVRSLRDDLLTDLADHLPAARVPALPVAAPT